MNGLCRLVAGVFVAWPLAAGAQTPQAPVADSRITTLVAAVSEQRLQQLNTTLAGFVTRQTLSDPSSSNSIGAARQWIWRRSRPRLLARHVDERLAAVADRGQRDGVRAAERLHR